METTGQRDVRDVRDLSRQIVKSIQDTKQLAKDIPISNYNFLMLAVYLEDLEKVMDDFSMEDHKVLNSVPVWTALSRLEGMTDTAYRFVKACARRSRIFLLYRVTNLLNNIREIFKDLANGLAAVADALPVDHREGFAKVSQKLCNVSFYMLQEHQQIAEEIRDGLASHHVDEPYATSLLRKISELLSVPLTAAAELKLELLRDHENSGFVPGDPEYNEMQSLCELLNPAAVLADIGRLVVEDGVLARYGSLPVNTSFICPITGQFMRDPVMLVEAGFTYEKEAICEWFDRGNRTCPNTGEVLESLELVPNLTLRDAITEFFERASRKSLTKAIDKIHESGSTAEVEEAVDIIKLLSETSPNYKRLIASMDGIPALIGIVKRNRDKMPGLFEKVMKLLLSIASIGDEYRIMMKEHGLIPALIQYLWRSDRKNTLGLQLLYEISKVEAGRKAIMDLDLEKKALMSIAQAANDGSEESRSLAEKVLDNLCQERPSVVITVAKYQVFRPLINMLSEGVPMDIRAEMATAVAELQFKDCSYSLLVKAGVIEPLLNLLQNGREKSQQIAAAKALQSLSAVESNRVDICKAGAIPALVKFISASEQDLKVTIMGTLANLATDHQAVTEMDQEGAVPRLLSVVQLDALVHEFALRTLQCMAGTSKTVRLSIKEHNAGAYFLSLLHRQELTHCRASTLSLVCHLADDRDCRPSILLSRADIDLLLRFLKQTSRMEELESILGILAGMSKVARPEIAFLKSDAVLLALVNMLDAESKRCQDYAAVALSKLMDPSHTSVQNQLFIAANGGILRLVKLLKVGSVRAKCASAVVLGLLSQSTPRLTRSMSLTRRLISCAGIPHYQRCKVHVGKCSVKTTMCLVESGAALSLLDLLGEKEHQSAEKAIHALATLIQNEENTARGLEFLVRNNVIPKLMAVLGKSESLTNMAVRMIERIFSDRRFRDERYWHGAQSALCVIIATGPGDARRAAAASLEHLGLVPRGSTYTH